MRRFTVFCTLLTILCYSIVSSSLAQSNSSKFWTPVISPSPAVASLGKYGDLPVELSTGTASANIPLYSLKLRNEFSIDFALNYATNGVRIDDIAGNVGTDWSFLGMFAIKRTVFDDPDELSVDLSKFLDKGLQPDSLNKFLKLAPGANADAQPDLFTLVAPGFSAKFYLSKDTAIFLNRNTSFKIKRIPPFGFEVRDGKGNVFLYGGDAIEKTMIKSLCPSEVGYYPNASFNNTAWFLKNIITAGKDTLSFSYSNLSHDYTGNINITDVVKQGIIELTENCGCDAMSQVYCSSQMTTQTKKLDAITSPYGKITFDYANRKDNDNDLLLRQMVIYNVVGGKSKVLKSARFDYAYGQNKKRPFLSRLVILSGTAGDSLSYAMAYNNINSLPDRLSPSVDGWGYYNGSASGGEVNPSVAYYGTLSKITYPTGGYDSLQYENNMEYGRQSSIQWSSVADLTGYGLDDHQCKAYTKRATIRKNVSFLRGSGEAVWEFSGAPDLNMHKMEVQIKDAASGKIYYWRTVQAGKVLNYDTIPVSGWFNGKDSVVIDVIMTACGEHVYGRYYLNQGAETGTLVNMPYGGLRIKKVVTGSLTGSVQIKKYYYNSFSNPQNSSGQRLVSAHFREYYETYKSCGRGYYAKCFFELDHNKSMTDLFSYSSAPMYYSNVAVGYGEEFEDGCTRHEFDIHLPKVPTSLQTASTVSSSGYFESPFSIQREQIAVEKVVSYYKKSGDSIQILKKVESEYGWPESLIKAKKGYTFRQRVFIPGTELPEQYYYTQFDLNGYQYTSSWFGKSKVKETTYTDDGKAIVKETKMFYDNIPVNNNVSRTEEATSGADTLRALYKYATNFKSQLVYDSMAVRNMVDLVVDQSESRNRRLIQRNLISFGFTNGNGSPIAPVKIQLQQSAGPLEERYSFSQYDGFGNILQRAKDRDVTEVYLWGYYHQYPVAKIIGSSYSAVSALVNPAVLENPLSDQQLRDELNGLRTKLAGKALVSTYTYEPMVGLSSETDEVGRTTYYLYDGMGRLSMIKDRKGRILKVFCYNYAGQREECGGLVFYNKAITQTFTKTCPAGYVGSKVTYAVPAGKWSAGSQAEADKRAKEDMDKNGQANANTKGTCSKLYGNTAMSGTYYKTCGTGGESNGILYSVPAGKYQEASQAEADRKAQAELNTEGPKKAERECICTYKNQAQSGTFIKTCPAPYKGSSVIYTVGAGKYTSNISLNDANQKAKDDMSQNGQAYADANGKCAIVYAKIEYRNYSYPDNGQQTQVDVYVKFFSDKNCSVPFPVTGLTVKYQQIYTMCESTPSVSNKTIACNGTETLIADDFILEFNPGPEKRCWKYEFKISMGDGYLPCGFAYKNTEISQTYTRTNCGEGYQPGAYTYVVPAGKHESAISQNDAQQKATADLAQNGQKEANLKAPCYFIYQNDAVSRTAKRSNCGEGYEGENYTYSIPAGKWTSIISKNDANDKATKDLNDSTQLKANLYGTCKASTKYFNDDKSASFVKQCDYGYQGSAVIFPCPYGKFFSYVSKDEANRLAEANVRDSGQIYANIHGTCTPLTPYARIEYKNIVNDNDGKRADVYVRFYSDENFNFPYSVQNLSINYQKKKTYSGESPSISNLSISGSGEELLIETGVYLIYDPGEKKPYTTEYTVTAGSGYTPKPTKPAY